jgi:predicted DNA-binding protein YlxM (UPF0122 family)
MVQKITASIFNNPLRINNDYIYCFLKIWSWSLTEIQKSSSLKHIIENITRLKQQLEYFERHVQLKNQEVKKEYFRALSQVLKAEEAIHLFVDVFDSTK